MPARKFRLVGGGEGRKREAISLIAAVKERKKRGNGTKTLHNHAVTPIKESSFPSNFSSLAAISFFFFFFYSLEFKERWTVGSSKEETILERKHKRGGKLEESEDASTMIGKNETRPFAFKLLYNYCILRHKVGDVRDVITGGRAFTL